MIFITRHLKMNLKEYQDKKVEDNLTDMSELVNIICKVLFSMQHPHNIHMRQKHLWSPETREP